MAQRVATDTEVDPFIGIDGGGDVFPGPSMPFGMVKPGPDTGNNDQNAGWGANGDINGFSQTHVSGTGGGASYGNILVQPTTGEVAEAASSSPRADEMGALGLYSVTLKRFGIKVDVTTAAKASLYRFKFPAAERSNLLFDVGHCLSSGLPSAENQVVTNATVEVVSPTEVKGSTSVQGGWNKQPVPYTVYFYAITDTPADSWGTWKNGKHMPGNKAEKGEEPWESSTQVLQEGAWLTFRTTAGQEVKLKVGISFVSTGQAEKNAKSQIEGFDFEKTRTALEVEWDRVLGAVEIEGATPEQRKIFYTALYHSMLMPVDRTGENPLWQSSEPYYDDFYTIWDTFRATNPLLTLIAPERETAIARALVDTYRHDGWLPDGRMGNYNGRTQGGSDADFVIADAYVKGLKGIDWETAYQAVWKDAERTPWDQFKEGRGDLEEWLRLGYLSVEGVDRPASKQMEYAANDYAVAVVAKGLGKDAEYRKFLGRSNNWKNLWDKSFSDEGFQGFIRPRHDDGTWVSPFSAKDQGSWYGHNFYEGDTWTYSLFVPQDVRGLMELCGGKEKFVARLDQFFPTHFDIGNEPGFLTPYLYIWAGRHDKTAEHVRQILGKGFGSGRSGLPGNDDSGAMSSLYVWGMIGIFPNAGQDVYLIGSPFYPSTSIHLPGGKTFRIEAPGASATKKYVVAAELNGKPLNQAWFRHADIANGGTLALTMSDRPNAWPSGPPPPSASGPGRNPHAGPRQSGDR